MNKRLTYTLTVSFLLLVPLGLAIWKYSVSDVSFDGILPQEGYEVRYAMSFDGDGDGEYIKAFIPETNNRQTITEESHSSDYTRYDTYRKSQGKYAEWRAENREGEVNVSYAFLYRGTAERYDIPDNLNLPDSFPKVFEKYLLPTENIQSDHQDIIALRDKLSKGKNQPKALVDTYFSFIKDIPSAPFKGVTDALTAYRLNEASCNGKSRLLVALCRASGIPAKLIGGIVLDNGTKRTSHQWVEIFLGDTWVPFDPLNGHFAFIPSNYMELYQGDVFLFSRSPNINFDYEFQITKKVLSNVHIQEELEEGIANVRPIQALFMNKGIPLSVLKLILMLPLGALIVAIFRNVIGVKTYGVFLPVLIAVSMGATGLWFGILSFVAVTVVVGMLHFPLENWGILRIPRLAIMLVGVVACFLGLAVFGTASGLGEVAAVALFPIVILTITAERFARSLEDDGFKESLKLLFQTLAVTIFAFFIVHSVSLQSVFFFFPELFLMVPGILLLIGKWIGIRLTEYKRFHWIAG